MDFRVLGPVELIDGSRPVEVRSTKQRMLLAALLCNANTPMSDDQLIDLLWGDRPPRTAAENLRVYVYHLRRALGDGERIRRCPSGYAISVCQGELDVDRFESLAANGAAAFDTGRVGIAAATFGQALALWRGQPYADVPDVPLLCEEARRLDERRQAVLEQRVEADLVLGKHAELVAELCALVNKHPVREGFCAQLMLALYRTGRQAEALAVFDRLRSRLAGEFGLDPGWRLRRLQEAILRGDPALDDRRPGWLPEVPAPADGQDTTGAGVICPYPGLAPFDVADARLFFGRERLIAEGMARLGEHRLLAVVGPSGSGKSSLARAGLLAELTAADDLLDTAVLRPGSAPMAALAPALASTAERLVVLVDQCEEAFTECTSEADRAEFFEALTALAAAPGRRVVVVLRADYYGHCTAHPAFAEAVAASQVLVGPMGEAELRRAIERPAGLAGVQLAEGLTDALVADVVGRPGALPLLATALRELWTRCTSGVLTLEQYVAGGGVQGAVADVAERAYAELPVAHRETARRVLLRLAAPGDGTTLVRRRVPRGELAGLADERVDAVVNTLVAHRLLTVEDDAVEIVHEAVLEQWPRLRAWLSDDLAGLRLHRALTAAAVRWQTGGRDPEDLLRGVRLAATVEWAASRSDELTDVEAEFLAEGRTAAELAAERARARIALQARANRRLRWLVVALVVVLLGALGASGLAMAQWRRADDRTREATGRELAARSGNEADLDRALLLAVAGHRLGDSPATRGALLSALVRSDRVLSVDVRPEPVLGMAPAPDGSSLVTTGTGGAVHRLDTATRRSVPMEHVDGASLGRPAISPDGRTLAVGAISRGSARIVFWDMATGRRIGERPVVGALPVDIAWRADGTRLAAAGKDEVLLVDLAGGTTGIPFPELGGMNTTDVEYTPIGLLAANERQTVVYDPVDGTERFRVDVGGPAALSADGTVLLLGGGSSRSPAVVDVAAGRRITARMAQMAEGATRVAWSGDFAIVTTLEHEIHLWQASEPSPQQTLHGHTGNITGAVVAADGRTLYTAALDQRTIAWDLAGDQGFRKSVYVGQTELEVAIQSDGRRAAVIRDGQVSLMDTATGAVAGTPVASPTAQHLAFNGDNTRLAVAYADGVVRIWDTAALQPAGRAWRVQGVQFLRFSPGGRLLLAGTAAGAQLWDVPGGQALGGPPGQRRVVSADFVTEDQVVLGGVDGVIELLDVRQAWLPRWHAQVPGSVRKLAVAGQRLLVGDSRGWLHGWDLTDGRELWPSRRIPSSPAIGLAVDRTGTLVAMSGGGDRKVHLWDTGTGVRIADLPHTASAGDIAFDHTRNRLLVNDGNGWLTSWDLDHASWQRRACAITGRDLTAAEWAETGVPRPATPLCAPS